MYRIVISAIILGVLSGCVQTRSSINRGDAKSAFWGKIIEADGTEYSRMGDMLIMTRDGKSR
jgi:hypothetical protein